VSWAHPKFGTFLASGSYAGAVHIHRETAPPSAAAPAPGPGGPAPPGGGWALAHASAAHAASVNAVAWAPHEAGCLLAAASSDGNVSLLELSPAAAAAAAPQGAPFAQVAFFPAHLLGANCVSWAPGCAPGAVAGQRAQPPPREPVRRLVTGGSDCAVKVWELKGAPAPAPGQQQAVEPVLVCELPGHTDWVRDVAWSGTVLRKSYIASASQDRTVRIWTSENGCTFPPRPPPSSRSILTLPDSRLDVRGAAALRRRRLARELEPERQRAGRQHGGQPGQPVEGEAQRRVGVHQDRGRGVGRSVMTKSR
jgi:WD40 repeat protein